MANNSQSQPLTHSALWKSAMLATDSTYFPMLVEAAAWYHSKPYSNDLLRFVSVNPDLLSAITVPINDGMDAILTQYASNPDTAGVMDHLILAAVEAYKIPESEGQGDPETYS